MMNRPASLLLMALLAGCGSKSGGSGSASANAAAAKMTPEAACKKMMAWDKVSSEADKKKNSDDCLVAETERQKNEPKEWECVAACLEKSSEMGQYAQCAIPCGELRKANQK